MDGADDGAAALGQPFHQGHHLEAGGTVQATASQRHREMLKTCGMNSVPQVLGEWAVTAEGGPVATPLQGRAGFPQLLELFKGDTSTRAVCAACYF